MIDLKEFWDSKLMPQGCNRQLIINQLRESLGLFFWEETLKEKRTLEYIEAIKIKQYRIESFFEYWKYYNPINSNYCVACLGEDKVKELIKKEKGCLNE